MIRFGERAASRRDIPGSKSVSSSAFRVERQMAGPAWAGVCHDDPSNPGLSRTAEMDKQKREQKLISAGVKPIQLAVNESRKLDFDNLNIRKKSVESNEEHANAVLHRINSKLDHILKRNEILEKSGLFSIKENEEKRRRPSLTKGMNESTPRQKETPSISKPPQIPKEILRPVWVSFGSRSRSKISLNSKGSKDSKDSKEEGSAKGSGKQLLEENNHMNNSSSLCLSKKSGYRIRFRNSSSKPEKDSSVSHQYAGHRDLTKSMISEDLSVISHDLSMKKTDGNFSILKLLDNSKNKVHTREKRKPESRRLFEGKENNDRNNDPRKANHPKRDTQVEYLDLHLQKQPQEGVIESKSIVEFVQVDKKHDSLKRDFFDRVKKQPRTGEVKTFQLADETDRKALQKAGSNSQGMDLSGYGSSLMKGLVHRTNQHVQVSVFEPRDSSNNSARNNFFKDASAKYAKSKHKANPISSDDPMRSVEKSGHFGSCLPEDKSDNHDRDSSKLGVSRSAKKVAELQKKLDKEINTKHQIGQVLKLALQKFSLPDSAGHLQDSLPPSNSRLLADKEISLQHRLIALLKKNKKAGLKIVFLIMARKLRDRKKEGLRKIYERALRKRR